MVRAQHDWEMVARDEPYYGVLTRTNFSAVRSRPKPSTPSMKPEEGTSQQ